MAKLKDIQLSQSGEPKEQVHKEPAFSFPTDVSQDVKKDEVYNVIFRLVKKKKGRTHIDGICNNVLNPNTKKRERAWLLMGASSIWQSELVEELKDKEYVKRSRYSLTFEDGICRISSINERELEFARVNAHNVGKNRNQAGKFDFYEYDPQEEQKERLKVQSKAVELVVRAKEMGVEQMKKLASFMGITFVDDLGMAKGDDGIRTELMIKANTQPLIFEKYLDSKEVEIAYMVKRAIIDAKIDLTAQEGNAMWAGGKGFIAKIPSNRKAYEYLTELAMTNSSDGRDFKEQLEKMST